MKKVKEVVILDFIASEVDIHSVEIPKELPDGQDTDEYIVEKLDIGKSCEYMIVDEAILNDFRK